MNQLSFQKFKKTLTELKEDSPKDTVEFNKLSPAEKQAVKDVFTLLGNTNYYSFARLNYIHESKSKKLIFWNNININKVKCVRSNNIPLW